MVIFIDPNMICLKKNRYISFVRNPISRVILNYFHIKSNVFRNHPDSYIVNKLDFPLEEFAKNLII